LLQRGFLAVESTDADRAWLHRPGVPAKLVGVRDIGVEDWFYSERSLDGKRTLDDAITEYERDLSSSIRELRLSAPGTRICARHAAVTVAHLVLRTAHLRKLVATAMTRCEEDTKARYTDPKELGAMMGLHTQRLTDPVILAIRDIAAKLALDGIPSAFSERLMAFLTREFGEMLVARTVGTISPIIEEMFFDLAEAIRDAHNEMLIPRGVENGWIASLIRFEWKIEGAADLILPDAVALACPPGGQLAPLFFTSAEEADLVAMPVASDRILVGRRSGAKLDVRRFNEDGAAASESFFIASRPLDGEALNDRIGTGACDALDARVVEILRECKDAPVPTNNGTSPVRPELRRVQDLNYTVRLFDFGDAVLVSEIAEIVQAVVGTVSRYMPLQNFDGLTIAVDHARAVAMLAPDEALTPAPENVSRGYGIVVGRPIGVARSGIRKEHLVISVKLAEMWMSPDPAVRALGIHGLVKMLGGIAFATRYPKACQETFDADSVARELHVAIGSCASTYWTARQAAFVAPDKGADYADLVTRNLDFAEQEVARERRRMERSGDIRPTMIRALDCVGTVLHHAADWLGHRHGLAEGREFAGSDLPARLKVRGLDHWIELFGRDLAACYGPEGTLELGTIITLSGHVERLFWSLGIYCWPEGDSVGCVASDEKFLPPQMD
jgi:hypothetical protein